MQLVIALSLQRVSGSTKCHVACMEFDHKGLHARLPIAEQLQGVNGPVEHGLAVHRSAEC